MGDVADQTVSYSGDGSRDSHIVKEIQPGAPVVSVTLGGPGQGAINTKPTWDPASLSRIGWNTRHDCQVEIVSQTTATRTIVVQPLNNNSLQTASWGTWCFPKQVEYIYRTVLTLLTLQEPEHHLFSQLLLLATELIS